MHNFLTTVFPNVKLEAVPGNIHAATQITSEEKESSDDISIRIFHIGNSGDMLFGDEEHVDTRLRMNIIEHYVLFVFIYRNRRDLTRDDGTKNAHRNTVRG